MPPFYSKRRKNDGRRQPFSGISIYTVERCPELDMQSAVLAQRMEMTDNPVMSRPNEADSELARLIERSQRGDQQAMEAIYGRYKTALFNLAYRYTYDRATAEDLLQEIFIKVFTHIGGVNRTETFTAWVYRIALNTCYSHLRSRKVEFRNAVPLDDVEPLHPLGQERRGGRRPAQAPRRGDRPASPRAPGGLHPPRRPGVQARARSPGRWACRSGPRNPSSSRRG